MDEINQTTQGQSNVSNDVEQAINNLPNVQNTGQPATDTPQPYQSVSPEPINSLEQPAPTLATAQNDSQDNNNEQKSYINSITDSSSTVSNATENDGDLKHIKDEALEKLRPLVDKLDQVPEEKFDTLIMLIRASDDKTLIKPAYEAAENIKDDQKRAKALLDIVNEVNYLTQQNQEEK